MASPPSVARLCSTFLAASLFQALFHRPTIVLFYKVFSVLLLVKFAPPIFRRLLSRKTVSLKIVRSKSAGIMARLRDKSKNFQGLVFTPNRHK